MNQPFARVNQPYATLTLASALREMFGVQLYKSNARALPSRILSILNLDWLQHARSVRGVYECGIFIERVMPFSRALTYYIMSASGLSCSKTHDNKNVRRSCQIILINPEIW